MHMSPCCCAARLQSGLRVCCPVFHPLLSSMITRHAAGFYLPGMLCRIGSPPAPGGGRAAPGSYAQVKRPLDLAHPARERHAHRSPCIRRDERAHLLRRKLFLRGICFGRVRNWRCRARHPAGCLPSSFLLGKKSAAGGGKFVPPVYFTAERARFSSLFSWYNTQPAAGFCAFCAKTAPVLLETLRGAMERPASLPSVFAHGLEN